MTLRIPSYTGASGAVLAPDAGLSLDPDRYAYQIKSDGAFCRITTDGSGRIDSAVSQNGLPIAAASDLLGIHAAPPYSTIDGELDAQTEAGTLATAERGYALLHLFDCVRLAGQPIARLPYVERHGSLYRAASWCESEGLARVRDWALDVHGNAHASRGLGGYPRTDTIPKVEGGNRDAPATYPGRFVAAIPRDLRRLPIIPLHRGRTAAHALWSAVERDGLEGLVAVELRAPVGRVGSKRKIKLTDTLDCTVTESDASHSRVTTDRGLTFIVPGHLEAGAVVEVAHNGYYRSGVPRFARVVRARPDKMDRAVPDRMALVEWAA